MPLLNNYSMFADVTQQVQQAGDGSYTVANVQADTGLGHYAGWSLDVAYRAPGDPPRDLTIFDGAALVSATATAPVDIPVQGFITPQTGPVNADVGVVAYEGDLGTTGDTLSFGGTTLSGPVTPANNFFNSGISAQGARITAKNPDYVNQMGFDAKTVKANGILANNSTGTVVSLLTNGDGHYPSVVTTAIDLYAPQLNVVKSVVDLNGGAVDRPGDVLRYTVAVSDTGGDSAKNVRLADFIPSNTAYVAGSLRIDGGPKTDVSGDD